MFLQRLCVNRPQQHSSQYSTHFLFQTALILATEWRNSLAPGLIPASSTRPASASTIKYTISTDCSSVSVMRLQARPIGAMVHRSSPQLCRQQTSPIMPTHWERPAHSHHSSTTNFALTTHRAQ